jgi:hypothetical protein
MNTDSSIRVRPGTSSHSFILRLVLIGLLVYAFLYDNSTSLPTAAGYGWTHLINLPHQIRFIEIGIVGIILLLLLARPVSRLTINLLLASLLFSAIAVISYLATPLVSIVDVLRLFYSYLLPALMFIIGCQMPVDSRERDTLFRIILIWVAISAVVSWYQFIRLGYPIGDDITGLNKDAHANGNLLVLVSLVLLARGLWLKRRREIGLALFFMVTMVLSSVLKTMFFSIMALGYMAYVYVAASKTFHKGQKIGRFIGLAVLLAMLVGSVYIAFTRLDLLSSANIGKYYSQIYGGTTKFGPLTANINGVRLVESSPKTLLIGYGPYSYGNPVSVGQTLERGSLSRYAQEIILLQSGETGVNARITLTSSWMVELGPLATAMLVLIYGIILIQVWRCTRSDNPKNRAYAVALVGCLIVMYLTAVVSLFGSLDVISVSWPVMLLAGMTVRSEKHAKIKAE